MTRTLDSAVLLTREGVGHGSYGINTCADSVVDAALIHGARPADGTVCETDTPATTGPLVPGNRCTAAAPHPRGTEVREQ